VLEVVAVRSVHLGRDLDVEPCPVRDLDGAVDPLLRRDSSHEREVAAAIRVEPRDAGRDAVVDRAPPVGPRDRLALRVRDGDERHLRELTIERLQIRQVEASVKRRQRRRPGPS
jgi:hypothetical protein